MFAKLNKKFKIDQYETVSEHIRHGKTIDEIFYGLIYHKVQTTNSEIFDVLPKRYQKDFHLLSMTINNLVGPHTDTGVCTVLNFYIQPENARTIFYKCTDESKVQTGMLGNNGRIFRGKVYPPGILDEAESFVAEQDDAYLLDVSQPHAVVALETNSIRKALSLHTSVHPFADVLDMLRETKFLE